MNYNLELLLSLLESGVQVLPRGMMILSHNRPQIIFGFWEFHQRCQLQGTLLFLSLAPFPSPGTKAPPFCEEPTLMWPLPTHLITKVPEAQVNQLLFPETLLLVLSGKVVSFGITKLTECESWAVAGDLIPGGITEASGSIQTKYTPRLASYESLYMSYVLISNLSFVSLQPKM